MPQTAAQQAHYLANKQKYADSARRWRKNNPEKVRRLRRKYRNPVREKVTTLAWREAHPERVAAMNERNKEKKSRPEVKVVRAACVRLQRATVPQVAIATRLRNRIRGALSTVNARKEQPLKEYLGCTIHELKVHLESLFLPGMGWENKDEWHIDHRRPCASFDLTRVEEQKACFHYTNLQPLWASANIRKRAKWQEAA